MLKQFIFTFIIFNLLVLGCTRYHTVHHSQFAYNRLNKELKRKQGYVALTNGQQKNATNIQVAVDSTQWVDAITQKNHHVSTFEINEIVIDKDLRSKTQRMGTSVLGGAFGGAFGGLIIWSTFAGETGSIDYYSKVGCLYGSMAGGLFGLVYEVIGGTTHKYTIKASEMLSGASTVDNNAELPRRK